VTVTNPDGGSATKANAYTVSVSPPTLGSVSPGTVSAGGAFSLTGTGFQTGAVVRLGSTTIPSNVTTSTAASATVPANTTAGVYDVSITNPDGQGAGLTGALTVTALSAISHTTLADFNAGTPSGTSAT